jgi:hypothetical protein
MNSALASKVSKAGGGLAAGGIIVEMIEPIMALA